MEVFRMKRYVMLENGWLKEDENGKPALDLLEDKDLIECGNEGNVIQYDAVFDEVHEYKNVVAIWKRNGDVMRRYEVKDND
jgi:hypothetical protein